MQYLVLGAGLQGAACAYDLLQTTDGPVTLADVRRPDLPPFLAAADTERLNTVGLDASDHHALRKVMQDHDSVLCALPYYFNLGAARAAVEAGVHFADLGGNTEIVRQQEAMDEEARAKGVSVLPDCGLAPGMVNILAADGIARLDSVDSVKLFVGGLPQEPEPPLNYQIVYSLEGALDYYTTPSWVLRGSRPVEIDALSEIEAVEFPSPVGTLEAFHTGGGISTMPWDYEGQIASMEYKTLRYPGHAHIMRAIRELGLLDLTPVQVDGATVRPRDAFVAVVDSKLRKPDGKDLVAIQVVVAGTKAGSSASVTYRVMDFYDPERGISAMMRTTAFSLSITGQMQADGRIGEAGVRPAYKVTPAGEYLNELQRRGIAVTIEEE